MQPDQSAPPAKRLSGCGCALIGASVTLVVLVALFVSWRIAASRRVESELARLRAAGQPTTADELATFYAVPPEGEDTTQLWLDGVQPLSTSDFVARVKSLPVVGSSTTPVPPLDQDWPDLPAVQQLLAECQFSLDKFHEAAAKGGRARYAVKFQDGLAVDLVHAQDLRTAARLLTLEAIARARAGDAHGAAESIHAIFMAARSLENEPIFVSQLVRIAVHSIAITQIEECLPHVPFDEADLRMLQSDLRAANWHDSLARGLAGERVLGIQAFRDPSALDHEAAQARLVMTNEDLHFYLQLFRDMQAAADEPWPEMLKQAEQVELRLKDAMSGSPLSRARHVFSGLMFPAVVSIANGTARAEALSHATDAAIAVELYHRRHGRLPAKLDVLVPEFLPRIPVDPFDGQPLRYLVRADEYVIYSIGADRIDNAGEKQDNPTNEIVITVKRRAKALPAAEPPKDP